MGHFFAARQYLQLLVMMSCAPSVFPMKALFVRVYVEFGQNIGSLVRKRVLHHLDSVEDLLVRDISSYSTPQRNALIQSEANQLLILALGNSTLSLQLIPQSEVSALQPEGFRIVSKVDSTGFITLAGNGRPLDGNTHRNVSFNKDVVHYGAVLASYASLELLGFGFLHPLEPYVPPYISLYDSYEVKVGEVKCTPFASRDASHSSVSKSEHARMERGEEVKGVEEKTEGGGCVNSENGDTNDDMDDASGSKGGGVKMSTTPIFSLNITEQPYWPERSFHIHTQHPLELTDVLQGHDIPQFGPHGPHCAAYSNMRREKYGGSKRQGQRRSGYGVSESENAGGRGSGHHDTHGGDINSFTSHTIKFKNEIRNETSEEGDEEDYGKYERRLIDDAKAHSKEMKKKRRAAERVIENRSAYCERWEDMVEDVSAFFEWSVANRLNKVEWLLLGSYKWGDELATRAKRLRVLTALGHEYSLMVGADVPLGNVQQHAWYIVNTRLPFKQQVAQIKSRVDWIFQAGFDFMTTESGQSEFTHPECDLMLDLINTFADYINGTWGREAAIKVHCSTGQVCGGFPDPSTGEPVNFNFLPMFATSAMGVYPHTVQMYGLDDPTAGAYGNDNFSYIEDYMVAEAKRGNRSVVYYGETAYWVNVDVDVPLFLPIYGQRRLHDLRRIAGREKRENFRIQGQMNFDSGWEWGYWLSDVVTARASWNPLLSEDMLIGKGPGYESYKESSDQWEAFAVSLLPVTAIFGKSDSSLGHRLNKVIVSIAEMQAELLIWGRIKGVNSPNLKKLSGIPYLSGDDTWIDFPRLFSLLLLQPDKIHLRENKDPDWVHVLPLLREMESVFSVLAQEVSGVLLDAENHYALQHITQTQRQTQTHSTVNRNKNCGNVGHRGTDHMHVYHDSAVKSVEIDPYGNEITESTSAILDTERDNNSDAGKGGEERGEGQNVNGDLTAHKKATATESTLLPPSSSPLSSSSPSPSLSSTPSVPLKSLYPLLLAVEDDYLLLSEASLDILRELDDCATLLLLRVTHARLLYESRDKPAPLPASKTGLQREARALLGVAREVVERREGEYRVPLQRVAGWREGPTVYRYGYLWSVHSLYYWWRDQGLAEEGSLQAEFSPCYLNRMDISEVAVGWGKYTLELLRILINRFSPFTTGFPLELVNCFAPPPKEYVFPRDLYPTFE